MPKSRKQAVSAFGFAVFLVLFSSTAYACTVWVGKFSVSNDLNSDSDYADAYEKVSTYGLATGMNHCFMEGAVKAHVGDPDTPSTVLLEYGSFSTSSVTACAAASRTTPTNGTYTISYLNTGFGEFAGGNSGVWDVDKVTQREYVRDCMAVGGAASTWIDSDDELVVSSGSGSESTVIDPKPETTNNGDEFEDLPGTESAICIQQKAGTYTGAPDGGQVPVIVI